MTLGTSHLTSANKSLHLTYCGNILPLRLYLHGEAITAERIERVIEMSILFNVFYGGLAGSIKSQIRATSYDVALRMASCNGKIDVIVHEIDSRLNSGATTVGK